MLSSRKFVHISIYVEARSRPASRFVASSDDRAGACTTCMAPTQPSSPGLQVLEIFRNAHRGTCEISLSRRRAEARTLTQGIRLPSLIVQLAISE